MEFVADRYFLFVYTFSVFFLTTPVNGCSSKLIYAFLAQLFFQSDTIGGINA